MRNYWDFFKILLKKHYKLLLSLVVVFILGSFSLFFVSNEQQEIIFAEVLKKVLEIDTSNTFLLFLRIWWNNTFVLLISFFTSFLYFPVFFIEWINGLILSLVAVKVISSLSLSGIIIALLPHGIIELPVFFIGSWLSLLWWTKIYFKDKIFRELSRWEFTKKIAVYFVILFLLLGIAALIEVYLTPLVLKSLGINL